MLQNNKNLDIETLVNQNKIVLVDFFASWCKPCQKLMPILDNFVKTNTNIKLIKIDADLYPDLLLKYNIKSFPTLILFKNGKIKKREGYCSQQELTFFLKEN